MQITEVFECHNKTVTRESSSQRKSRRLSGKLQCLNFVFPAENETLGLVCLGCEASSSSLSLSILKVPIQIRQLINDIKCASALADCVTLCRSATVINIRILLTATSYFSPSLHYVWIFTSRIFLNKKNWVDYWVYHCLNLKLRLRQYPLALLSLSYHR